MILTVKERNLLEDLKAEELLCVTKYSKYSSEACDGELKNLFTEIGSDERKHLETLCQLLGEQTPEITVPENTEAREYSSDCKKNDEFLCKDALSMEKYVSGAYDTDIFEFNDSNIRSTLNQIQKDEQNHGDKIYKYMSAHSMQA